MEDFSSHLWRDAIERTGLNSTASNVPNGTKSKKLENICRKIVEQAKYLASIYQPYTFYGGRWDDYTILHFLCLFEKAVSRIQMSKHKSEYMYLELSNPMYVDPT